MGCGSSTSVQEPKTTEQKQTGKSKGTYLLTFYMYLMLLILIYPAGDTVFDILAWSLLKCSLEIATPKASVKINLYYSHNNPRIVFLLSQSIPSRFFTIRSDLHFKPQFTSRGLKTLQQRIKLLPVGTAPTVLPITGLKVWCLPDYAKLTFGSRARVAELYTAPCLWHRQS